MGPQHKSFCLFAQLAPHSSDYAWSASIFTRYSWETWSSNAGTDIVVFISTVLFRGFSGSRMPSLRSAGYGDAAIGFLIIAYFLLQMWMMAVFDPTTHISTGVHQIWCSVCRNNTAFDIMGFERQDYLSGEYGPTDASRGDFRWGKKCGARWHDSIAPSGDGLVEWYTVCGVANEPELGRMSVLAFAGVVLWSSHASRRNSADVLIRIHLSLLICRRNIGKLGIKLNFEPVF